MAAGREADSIRLVQIVRYANTSSDESFSSMGGCLFSFGTFLLHIRRLTCRNADDKRSIALQAAIFDESDETSPTTVG
jgi:hypothetical protein